MSDSNELPGDGVWGDIRSPEQLQDYLNRLGRQGWKVLNIDVLEQQQRINFVGVAHRPLRQRSRCRR